jgi:two-component system, OmpR family, sensor histidine kinase KdpD
VKNSPLYSLNRTQQFLVSILIVSIVSAICYGLSAVLHYRVVALILLVTVSFIAMFYSIAPVMVSAILSALIWNFFFIPPKYTLHIENAEDALMFLMYFIIALVNAVLTNKIRQIEKVTQKRETKENTLKLYNTLLNSLSHELRTPIATIIGATDNLQMQDEKLSKANKKELIDEISKASLRLNRQVENLLNMSRLESGFIQPKKDWCDISELLYDVVNRIKENVEDRPINIIVKENLPLFKIDYGLIEHVVYNLVLNAVLYVPKYSAISIKANCIDGKLILIVEDTGHGFPEDEIGKVFEKFYRLKNSQTGGTGLGLSIVKGFVEAHDGTINLENIPEGGSKFTIRIPAETSYITDLKNE